MSTPEDVENPEDIIAGDDPNEEAGPDGCDVDAAECELKPGERDQPPEDCSFTPHDELSDQFPVEPIPVVRGKDGLVQPVDMPERFAPPFTREHVVCLEDDREYVELFAEELELTQWVPPGRTSHDGTCRTTCWTPFGYFASGVWCDRHRDMDRFEARSQYDRDGAERERERYEPSRVVHLWGVEAVKIGQGYFSPVRPVRERCRFYKRQVFNNDDQPDPTAPGHRIYFTNCTARRSVGGAFLSLRDQAVYACDYRVPPDPESVAKHLDSFDRRRLAEEPHKKLIPMFGLGGDDLVRPDDEDGDG